MDNQIITFKYTSNKSMNKNQNVFIIADMDEGQLLNGKGSSLALVQQMKHPKKKSSLSKHLLDNSTIYIAMFCLLVASVAIIWIEKEYPKNPPTSHQNKPQDQNTRGSQISNYMVKGFGGSEVKSNQVDLKPHNLLETSPVKAQNSIPNPPTNVALAQNQNKINQSGPKKQTVPQQPKSNGVSSTIAATNPPVPSKPPQAVRSRPSNPAPAQNAARSVAGISEDMKKNAVKWLQLKNENLTAGVPLSALAEEEKAYYEAKYSISKYEELPFCIVIPSFNNVKNNRHINNIKSVLMQDYKNYHIVFIDDASTDGTGDQIEKYLKEKQNILPPERYVIVKNKQQLRASPNLRRAAKQFCKPQQIYLIADGDDQLLGKQVLKLFNAIFQRDGRWFVYTNFLSLRHSIGYSRPFPTSTIKSNKYRTYPFVTSHLRAFYTQLFLNIKEEDLKNNNGSYLRAANDVAICIPILEMAHERVAYVPQLTYYYNSNTGQNNHILRLKEQKDNDRMLRYRKAYEPLKELFPSAANATSVNSTDTSQAKTLSSLSSGDKSSNPIK